ncbi:MAG: helix-turn-helix transcriptional regulator, partial [Chloroflexi bacterium]|nr:helix-turn-helix transcriptional regulator [Chloroflexota bacterium]
MIGARLRKRRKELGLSLRELGARTELTAGFLSQVEKDQASPSLASLQRIATALEVPMFYFHGNAARPSPVVRAAERRKLYFPDTHIVYELLTADFTRQMMGFVIRMEPGARRVAARLARPT